MSIEVELEPVENHGNRVELVVGGDGAALAVCECGWRSGDVHPDRRTARAAWAAHVQEVEA